MAFQSDSSSYKQPLTGYGASASWTDFTSTTNKKFGDASLSLNGTTQYVELGYASSLQFGAGDFTVEGYVYFNAVGTANQVFLSDYENTTNNRAWFFRITGGNKLSFGYTTDGITVTVVEGTWTPTAGAFYHIAVARSGSTLRVLANGAVIASASIGTASIFLSNQPVRIGVLNSNGYTQFLNGCLDEVRITKGVARYTGAYTVPTAEFGNNVSDDPNFSNVVLLAHFNNVATVTATRRPHVFVCT